MKIKVELTNEESEQIFDSILCNCVGTGYFGYGLELEYNRHHYKLISDHLKENGYPLSHEDVLMGILRDGGTINFVDVEGDGAYPKTISLSDIHDKIQNAPVDRLKAILDGTGDVMDEDVVLQYMLYGEIIFG